MKIVILTCDKHAWLMPVFVHFYKKYWPDNPYRTNIITESNHLPGNVFYTGGAPWSSGIINYLKQSDDDKYILMLEDHIIRNTIDTKQVEIAERLCAGKVGCVRLNYAPRKYFNQHSIESKTKGFRKYPLKERFSMTIQMAVWQKQFLFDVLKENESAWQTECNGTERLRKLEHKWEILWPEKNIIEYPAVGLLRKGILQPQPLGHLFSEIEKEDMECKARKLKAILQAQILRQREENK